MSIHGGVPKHLDEKNMLKIQDDLKCRSHLDMGQDNLDVYMDLYGSIWIYMADQLCFLHDQMGNGASCFIGNSRVFCATLRWSSKSAKMCTS